MEDVIASVFEEPILPSSYNLPTSFTVCMLTEKRKCNSFDINYITKKTEISPVFSKSHFLKSKINLDPRFEHVFLTAGIWHTYCFLKFKSVALITTVFIGETFLTRGIYPTALYDYERHFINSQYDNVCLEFLLVSAVRKQSVFFRVNKDKMPKAIEKLILYELQSQVDIYNEYQLLKRY